ncbi:cystathionine beta-lyase [Sphaerisporangium siamense]|uniref:cysteine-S-conjugate beta-lyase n=1 Tax=Sphaerisporangium siamense TaxID=795645 RepID=A0A7W7DA50_9ACTN|nr:aminotransferase class I/II-fold pyridoxal phosphate-dependent enzyme [Sphaerisporangium siamense]MBB4703079.1 cystathionine beta-lyase [Sphaerisporangium siamense]GII83155.1 cystathionine beta-lyase [Sphaerisporangium siamense]
MTGTSHGRTGGPLDALDLGELRARRSSKWREYPRDVLPVWVAEMDTPLAEPIAAALVEAVGRGDTGYAVAGGLPDAFAAFAARRFGWRTDPAAIRLVPDVMAGIVEVLSLVTEPGDRVVVNTPAYPPYFYWIPRIGRELVENALLLTPGGHRLDLAALERDFAAGAAAFLLCNPHNPTGVVFGEEDLLAVAALAARYGVRVVTDEIHAPLVFPGARHVPFAGLDAPAAARSITLASASKAWNLAGLKAALAVPGEEARTDVARIHPEVSEGAGLLGVIASEVAFTSGEPWLDELLAGLDANRALLGRLLAERLPEVGYQPPQATYLAWLDLRALGLGDDPAEWFLRRAGTALYPGPKFGAPGRGFARFNFATSGDRVTEAVGRMAASLSGRPRAAASR